MNLRYIPTVVTSSRAFFLTAGFTACSSGSPPPKDALDFGQSLAVALCQAEAPRRGFDPALCQAGSDFLRPFVDEAAKQFASAALADRGPVAASMPCPPFSDGPAPVAPGTSGAGGGK